MNNSGHGSNSTRRWSRKPRRFESNDGGGGSRIVNEFHEADVERQSLPSTSRQQNSSYRASSKSRRGRGAYVAKPQASSSRSAVSEECRVRSGEGSEVGGSEEGGIESGANQMDAVLKRLEELELGIDEPELEEEELSSNYQQQSDELVVVESIYGDNLCILDTKRGLRSFQINIHIESEGSFTLSTKLGSSTDHKGSKSDDFLYSFEVQHLPPIVLTCLLPKSYPSYLPPYFTIFAQWLNVTKITDLCSMLDSIWTEQPGQEVIFQWIEWLQNSSLSYLGFDKEISLGPYAISVGDKRAISGSVSADVDIPSIMRYNEEKCHDNFLKNLHDCCICFSEYAGSDFLRLPCHHFFCWKCMKTYSEIHIKEGTVTKLQCPNSECGAMVPPGLLKQLLGDEAYDRWESLTLQKTLDTMSDIVYCPRCETACIEDPDNHAVCSKCFFSFCTLCRGQRHVGEECMSPEIRLRMLLERQGLFQLDNEQRRKELEMINELKSMEAILQDAKQCPRCNMAISRTGGCNKMVCGNCGTYFCYRCNKKISGYEHFREDNPYGCVLFPTETIRNGENPNHMNPAPARQRIFPEHSSQCPNCYQLNTKMSNNNHILCGSCNTSYCYLCKETMRLPSEHFGPNRCKQHTPL